MKSPFFLTADDIKTIHFFQIDLFGGMHGIRDDSLLESAAMAPQATFSGEYLHKNIYFMAAAYPQGLVKNHPFIDGNKRTGIATMLLFLAYNNIAVALTNDELYDLGIAVATSSISLDSVAALLAQKSIKK